VRGIKLKYDLTYKEGHMDILEVQEHVSRSRRVKLYKVLWNDQSERDATWEREDYLRDTYPFFFAYIHSYSFCLVT
jgi:hypothetical protein